MVLATFCAALLATGVLRVLAEDVARLERGRRVYEKWCSGCHAPNSAQYKTAGDRSELAASVYAGTYALEQRYKGAKPAALEQRTDLTRDTIERIVRTGVGSMPSTRKTEISDEELADVAAYLTRNSTPGDSSRAR